MRTFYIPIRYIVILYIIISIRDFLRTDIILPGKLFKHIIFYYIVLKIVCIIRLYDADCEKFHQKFKLYLYYNSTKF